MPTPLTPPAGTNDFVSRLHNSASKRLSFVAASTDPHPQVKTVAVMVTHGMGQQVPFETCASIAECFVRGDRKLKPGHAPQANRVQLAPDADLLARMELVYEAEAGLPETHVHIYEGYWAPLTEGKISLTKTLLFLLDAGWNGIKTCITRSPVDTGETGARGTFTRWVFGKLRAYAVKPHTFILLVWILAFLLFGIVAGYFCENALTNTWKALPGDWTMQSFLALVRNFITHLGPNLVRIAGLVFVGLYVYWTRYFVVEFVGDVAIYVSSYKVSAFQEIRDAIQKTVLTVGKQIVAATDPNDATKVLYDSFVFVGHSLGSVVTYDLVNALLVWDATACNGRYTFQQRIRTLITFGSPLDKTAFLFRTQISPEHHYRETLAALMQPLILQYDFRTFPWINIHSHLDPVSGELDYYDWPLVTPTDIANGPITAGRYFVQNLIDPQARRPILAHTDYWNHTILTDQLLVAIAR